MSASDALSRRLTRHATLFMSVSVLTGLLAQDLARLLAPLVIFASMGAMFLTALRLDRRLLLGWIRRPLIPISIVLFTTLVIPAMVIALTRTGALSPSVALACALIAATPPIISVGPYCVFLGTDNELLSLSVLPATAVGILTLPFYASLAGLPGLEPARLALELLAVVGTAMGGAVLIRLFVPLERVERHAPALDVGALLLMVTVAIGVTDGLASLILAEPAVVVEAFVVTAVLSLVLQALGWLAFYRLGARVAGSVALVNGLRNMALLLGLLIGQVDASLQLLLVLGQLQLFLLPSVMRPLYRRLGVAPDQTAAP
jgi:BASS family bile acid:Na+ symporter